MKSNQAKFFDNKPVLYPWPHLLRRYGYSKVYKPRDSKFKEYLELLKFKKGDRILDVGCGDGLFLERVRKTYGIKGFGIDISDKSINRAKTDYGKNLVFKVSDATNIPFKNSSFDYVLSFDTLEHVGKTGKKKGINPEQKKAIFEMCRVLKTDGKILIYTINYNQKYTLNWVLDKLSVDVYKKWDHNPQNFLKYFEIEKVIKTKGLEINKIELFNSFFTLLGDELIMVLIYILNKTNPLKKNTKLDNFLGKSFINLTSIFSVYTLGILNMLDILWLKKGLSNSFFILATKNLNDKQ